MENKRRLGFELSFLKAIRFFTVLIRVRNRNHELGKKRENTLESVPVGN